MKKNYPKFCFLNKRRPTSEAVCFYCRRDCPFAGKRRSYRKKK